MEKEHKYTNLLINESSPYLLQHAHNPVNWHAWNDEALEEAKKANKLLIISVGYAACHWCHVMEKESFEDTVVAAIMNTGFIPIKVDREERPDIDQIYMDACNLISGSGGWPLNAIALPDGRPIFAGTYFPKEDWIRVLNYFQNAYINETEKVLSQAERLTQGIAQMEEVFPEKEKVQFSADTLNEIFDSWKAKIDMKNGGRLGAPKFPMPTNYLYLLNFYKQSGDNEVLKAVSVTLDEMAKGGIYDHLGGGFARYSVDAYWKVPHFEKMLYDNAQLVSLYSKAYQLTKNERYGEIVEETLKFIKGELSDQNGGFYSSLDADSEGEEGKFYTWSKAEIVSLLGKGSEIFCDYYSVEEKGNWENTNILYQKRLPADIAKKYDLTVTELHDIIETCKAKLMVARSERIRPGLDDKILTSWNALMITGYVDAYRAFRKKEYLEAALRNANFILSKCMSEDYRLNRNYKNAKSSINGFLDDYSFTIEAFIDLYQATFDEIWLERAENLSNYAIQHFYDESSKMFFYTSDLDPDLIVRKRELSDNVIPASNSSMAKGLYMLGMYLYREDYINMSEQMLNQVYGTVVKHASFYSNWAQLLLNFVEEPFEVAVVGKDYENVMEEFDRHFLPDVLFLGGKTEGNLELLKGKLAEGETTIYVCRNKACQMPVNLVEDALEQMKK